MIQVRASTYRGRTGFTISGTDPRGHHLRIFSKSREDAERIRANIKAGRNATEHWPRRIIRPRVDTWRS